MASVVDVDSDVTAPTNVVRRVMAKHPELYLVLFGLSLTVLSRFGSSLKTKPITVPPKAPKKFFPVNSPVFDFYNGELEPVVRLLAQEELIFLMYYAPWCAKSMAVRGEFHKAAKHMHGQVKFVAVNCWWPEGQCRKRYKFLMFPVMFVYHTHLDGFRYIGDIAAEHMVRFVEDVTYPLTPFHTPHQVEDLLAKHDSAVVGYFDLNSSPQPPGFLQFYFASMRTIEQDPYNQVKFCIITNKKLAQHYNLTKSNDVILLRVVNTTLHYPKENNFTSTELVHWSLTNRQQPLVRLLAPLGIKSLILSREIIQGPAVIAFYDVNQLLDTNQHYHMMKDVALHYHHCKENHNLEKAIFHWRNHISTASVEYHKVIEFCSNYRKQQNVGLYDFKCCVSLVTRTLDGPTHQFQNVCEYCVHKNKYTKPSCSNIYVDSPRMENWREAKTNSCINSRENYDVSEYQSMCCQSYESSGVAALNPSYFLPMSFNAGNRRVTDRYVRQQFDAQPRRLCRKLTLQKLQGHIPYKTSCSFDEPFPVNFTGLACQSNRTVNFYAMDAVHHAVFAERLGVNVSTLPEHPALVIVDNENEEQYLLKESFTPRNIASFILNFTHGLTRRSLRSASSESTPCDKTDDRICVVEVTSETFHSFVIESREDVLLFVYSSWCGFCANINHIYLSLAEYFHTAQTILFAKINGDTNDLPWEFTVDSYPALIFFPAGRKADSVVFPETRPVSLSNLIRFVLQHSTQNLRIETALGVCSKTCIQKNREYTVSTRQMLQNKMIRLRRRLSSLLSEKHPSETGQMFRDISIKYVHTQLQLYRNNLLVVDQLHQFLQESNGVFIEHSRLRQFMSQHKLLRESSL